MPALIEDQQLLQALFPLRLRAAPKEAQAFHVGPLGVEIAICKG